MEQLNGNQGFATIQIFNAPRPRYFSARHSKGGAAIVAGHTLYHQKGYIVGSSKL